MMKATESATESVPTTNFATLLAELKSLVERLEGGALPLEEALKDFEQGIILARRGQEVLDAAERKVEILLRDGGAQELPCGGK